MTKEMLMLKRDWDKKKKQKSELDRWLSSMSNVSLSDSNKKNTNDHNCIYYDVLSNPTPILRQNSDNIVSNLTIIFVLIFSYCYLYYLMS